MGNARPHQLDYAPARVDGTGDAANAALAVSVMNGTWQIEVSEPGVPHADDSPSQLTVGGLAGGSFEGLVLIYLPLLLLFLGIRWLFSQIRPRRVEQPPSEGLVTFYINSTEIEVVRSSRGFFRTTKSEKWSRSSVLELRRSRTRDAIVINVDGLKDHVRHVYPEHVLAPLDRALQKAMQATAV